MTPANVQNCVFRDNVPLVATRTQHAALKGLTAINTKKRLKFNRSNMQGTASWTALVSCFVSMTYEDFQRHKIDT